ncbi:MOSC domain-containing protein [Arsenicibacter rosenii]|uniref:MOSC domain-containing protein n=1 Tax=Arsenicibacter rosenii TaxID=1750698 RepID=A0A1S2VHY1_9BACT|nr:MOSC domain-containing protein [Arsenicibacter rosenii]OIN58361.1 MOSC domain-containing protein [Arsenicibacter rosenii]
MQTQLKELFEHFAHPGRIDWIGIRPVRRGAIREMEAIEVTTDKGIIGDHYSGTSGKRHITLIQAEHLPVIASYIDLEDVTPDLLRRNIMVSGMNLLALKDHKIRIGEAVILQITGACHPCSRMEQNLGPGGYNAVRGHGGLTARVLQNGTIRVGDPVVVL